MSASKIAVRFKTPAVVVHTCHDGTEKELNITNQLPQEEWLQKLPTWIRDRVRQLNRTNKYEWFKYVKGPRWEAGGLHMLVMGAISKFHGHRWNDHERWVRTADGRELLVYEPYHLSLDDMPSIQYVAELLGADVSFEAASHHYPLRTIRIAFERSRPAAAVNF